MENLTHEPIIITNNQNAEEEDIPLDTAHRRTNSENNRILQSEIVNMVSGQHSQHSDHQPSNQDKGMSISFSYLMKTNIKLQLLIIISLATSIWEFTPLLIFTYLIIADIFELSFEFRNYSMKIEKTKTFKKLFFVLIVDSVMGMFFKVFGFIL